MTKITWPPVGSAAPRAFRGVASLPGLVASAALVLGACAPAAPTPAATTAPAATAAPAAKPSAAAAPTTAPAAAVSPVTQPSASPAAASSPAAATSPVAAAAPAPTSAVPLSAYSAALQKDAQTTVDTTKYKKDGPYTIAALTQGPGNGWGLTYDVSIKYAADHNPDVKNFIFSPANQDANLEITQLEDIIQQKPDAIVLDPLGRAALSAPTNRAMAAGIPVILCANGVETDNFVTRVDVDLYKVAYQSADGLAKLLNGQGNVVMFSGIAGVDAAETWKQAAEDAFKNYPNIKIVASEYAQWSVATSKQKMEAIMAANPQIDGVWAGGGEMALGAALAFNDAAGRKQPVYGFANVLNGFLRVAKEGNLKFFGVPDPPGASRQCLEAAIDVLEGKPVKKFIDVQEILEGSSGFDQTEIDKRYIPQLNDDFVLPPTVPIDAYAQAGLARK